MEIDDVENFHRAWNLAMDASQQLKVMNEDDNQRSNHRRYQMSEVMTIKEVSEYLRIHPTTAYRLIKKGAIPSFQVGSDHRFLRSEIDRYARGEWQPK